MSFSVVIPLWNKRATIGATVASVLRQSWHDFELIVVDDGSTDGSAEALARIEDPRLRIVRQPNAGAGAARNRGISESRHDWIAFLDADDLWAPDHLAELDRIRRAEPGAALIGTAFAVRNADGSYDLPDGQDNRIESRRFFAHCANGWAPFCASSTAIVRETYDALGGFGPEPTSQDSVYFSRIAVERPVAFSNRVTVLYLRVDDSLGAQGPDRCGVELRSAREVSPVIGLLLDRYPAIADAGLRRDIDLYLDFRFGLCARTAARFGDLATLRTLSKFYLRPPRRRERLLFALARLPGPLARGCYRLGFALKAAVRRLRPGSVRDRRPAWVDELLLSRGRHAD